MEAYNDQNIAGENGPVSKPEEGQNGDVDQAGDLLKRDGQLTIKDGNDNIEDGDMMCGIGSWKPQFLQVFAKRYVAVALLCLGNFVTIFYLSLLIACITSIEVRYGLQSVYIGLCFTMYEVLILVSALPVAYFAAKPECHRPRMIGIGLTIFAVCNGLVTVVHFASEPYNYSQEVFGSNETSVCSSHYDVTREYSMNATSPDCGSSMTGAESDSMQATIILLLVIMISGACSTPVFVVAPALVDDIVGKTKSHLILGTFFAMYALGPVVGFPVASIFLGMYIDIGRVDMETIDLTPDDPRWVGAWWISYLFVAVISLTIGILLFFIPKRFPPSRSKDDDKKQIVADQIVADDDNLTKIGQDAVRRIKEFPRAIRRLFSNVALIAFCIGISLDCAVVAGLSIYVAKYTEEQFRISPSLAANLSGVGIAIPSVVGSVFGGILMYRLKLSPASMVKFALIINIIVTILPIPLLFLGCETDVFAGATVPYSNGHIVNSTTDGMLSAASSQLSSTCNHHCECTDSAYNPVCGSDGVTYYSPCFAGCIEAFTESNYSSCGCIGEAGQFGTAISGSCGQDCQHLLIIYVVLMFIITLTAGLVGSVYMVIPLRIVEPRDKPFALGIKLFFSELLGWAPTPLYIGFIIDTACVLWGTSECSDYYNCWVYDLTDFRNKLILFEIILKALIVVCFLITWLSLRKKERKTVASASKDNVVM